MSRSVQILAFDAMEVLDYAGPSAVSCVPFYLPVFLRYANPADPLVATEHTTRRNAVVGIGLCAKLAAHDVFAPYCAQALERLAQCCTLSASPAAVPGAAPDDDDQSVDESEESSMAHDNAVAALLRVVLFQAETMPHGAADFLRCKLLIFSQLPLLYDTDEALFCHDRLAAFVRSPDIALFGCSPAALPDPAVLNATAGEAAAALAAQTPLAATSLALPALLRVFKIIVQIIQTSLVSDETDAALLPIIRDIRRCLPAESAAAVWAQLPPDRQQVLTSLFAT
jgi:hypothetical protein